MEDKILESMNIISSYADEMKEAYKGADNAFFDREMLENAFKSSRYAVPAGYWTMEVFHCGHTLIPEEKVTCLEEPQLDQNRQMLDVLGSSKRFFYQCGFHYWRPVTVTYLAYGDSVGSMLINDWEELTMVHHATAELTYWLGVDKPERTWTMKDWMVQQFNTTPSKSAVVGVDLTFMFSEASLTRH